MTDEIPKGLNVNSPRWNRGNRCARETNPGGVECLRRPSWTPLGSRIPSASFSGLHPELPTFGPSGAMASSPESREEPSLLRSGRAVLGRQVIGFRSVGFPGTFLVSQEQA
jgi:hypothetical protein